MIKTNSKLEKQSKKRFKGEIGKTKASDNRNMEKKGSFDF